MKSEPSNTPIEENDILEDAVVDVVGDASVDDSDSALTDLVEPTEPSEGATDDLDEAADNDGDEAPESVEVEGEFVAPEPAIAEPEVVPSAHPDAASNNVLLPAILGGMIAAGIGFAIAYYTIPRANPELNATVDGNTREVESLRAELETMTANITESVDFSAVTGELEALTGSLADLDGRIADFDERLLVLEKQPSGDGTLQEAALQAYQRELDEIRAQVEEQASAAFNQLESTRAEAEQIEQAALEAARVAQVRAALAQVQTALTDGEPMQAALTDLEDALGEPVPAALAAVAEGAPTLAKLQADFPNAARAALSAARSGGTSGEDTTAFGAFLREQLNVRSVAPRDGDDADSTLSRAQAAVSDGKLQIALDEIATLPEAAKSQLSEWATVAAMRVAAVQAADDVSLSLNVN